MNNYLKAAKFRIQELQEKQEKIFEEVNAIICPDNDNEETLLFDYLFNETEDIDYTDFKKRYEGNLDTLR